MTYLCLIVESAAFVERVQCLGGVEHDRCRLGLVVVFLVRAGVSCGVCCCCGVAYSRVVSPWLAVAVMGTAMVMACDSSQLDVSTGVCSAPTWVLEQQGSFFPTLSVGDGTTIGIAIFTVWAIAWAYRSVKPSGD